MYKLRALSATLLTAILAIVWVPSASAAVGDQFWNGNAKYEVNTDGTSVTVINGTHSIDIVIPAQVTEAGSTYDVTTIGDGAFEDAYLTGATLPDSVTAIGDNAFDNNNLSTLDLPDNLASVGADAFHWASDSSHITSLTIPATLSAWGDCAFCSLQLDSVTFEDGLTTIGADAFENNSLEAIDLPDSLTTIGDGAFQYNSIDTITGSPTLASLGDGIFATNSLGAAQVESFLSRLGITEIPEATFTSNQLTGHLDIPAQVTSIGKNAFLTNSIESVSLPDGLTSMGEAALSANRLTSVTIPPGLLEIPNSAFSNNLLETLTIPATVTSIGPFAFEAQYDDTFTPTLTEIIFEGDAPTIALQGLGSYPAPLADVYYYDGATGFTTPTWDAGDKTYDAHALSSVTFDANGGTGDVPPQPVEVGDSVAPPTTPPTREHYDLMGWSENADGTQPWDFDTDTVDGSLTLYAAWNPTEYTVTAHPNLPGWLVVFYPRTYGQSLTEIVAPLPPREHHHFTEWAYDANGSQPVPDDATVQGDTDIYAQWAPNDYTVTLTPGNGEGVITQDVSYGDTVAPPAAPFLSGHTFTGWFDAAPGGSQWTFSKNTVEADTTLYAQYTENEHTVVAPTSAEAGDAIAVTGTGFDPNEEVTVELHSNPVTLTIVTADAAGTFTASGTIPADAAAGDHSIVATAGSGTASSQLMVTSVPTESTDPDDEADEASGARDGGTDGDDSSDATPDEAERDDSADAPTVAPETPPELSATGVDGARQTGIAVALIAAGLGIAALRRRWAA